MSYLQEIENIYNNLEFSNIEELENSNQKLNDISHILFKGFKIDPELKKIAKPLKECWIAITNLIYQKNQIESIERYKKALEKDILDLDKYFNYLNKMATYCKYFPKDLDYIQSVKITIDNHCEKYDKLTYSLLSITFPEMEKPVDLIEFVKKYCSDKTQQIIFNRF